MDENVKAVIDKILAMYPTATRFAVTSSDQNRGYGFWLINVGFDDTTIDEDSDTFSEFAEELNNDGLHDLDWGLFGDLNADTDFDVDISTGRIIRAS